MNKTALLTVFALLGSALGASAVDFATDSWTKDGNAWSSSAQPLFSSEHIIIANDRSGQSESKYGELGSSAGPSWLVRHLTGHSFYAGMSAVDFTLTPKEAVAGTQVVQLWVRLSFGFTDKPTLTVNRWNDGNLEAGSPLLADNNDDLPVEAYAPIGDVSNSELNPDGVPAIVDEPLELYIFTWTLDTPLRSADTFQVDFGIHRYASITEVTLTQVSVPEPSACALVLGSLAIAGVVGVRRRRCRV